MVVTLKRGIALAAMILVLLASLFGWALGMRTAPVMNQHPSIHSTHTIAWYCPPPPKEC
jgi:hypothetical protein